MLINRLKIYDKDGNEVTGLPEEGVTYYDADGNELQIPSGGPQGGPPQGGPGHGPQGRPPKMFDKDGNEVTGRPEEGVTYYDADGNELQAPPAGGHGPQGGLQGRPPHEGPHGGHGHGPQGQPPKMYDKDGNEVTGRPEKGVTYYDAEGNALTPPEMH
ncbi:MAG: hypothetical protein K5637_01370 [Lachnospiraceae bacterium]|nr:hypothetical protein [Lachnospiraceae bacterium]